MKKEKVDNESIKDEVKSSPETGGTPHDGAADANVADASQESSDTMSVEGEKPEPEAATELESVLAEWQDKYLRLQAEFDNYRKRTLKEKMSLIESGGEEVIKSLLPVIDDVDRALTAMEKSNDIEAIRNGVKLIAQKFSELLRQKGVVEIATADQPFDVDEHEAVARFPSDADKKGKVIDVVQKGYKMGDKVIRYAKVVVGE